LLFDLHTGKGYSAPRLIPHDRHFLRTLAARILLIWDVEGFKYILLSVVVFAWRLITVVEQVDNGSAALLWLLLIGGVELGILRHSVGRTTDARVVREIHVHVYDVATERLNLVEALIDILVVALCKHHL
jgi:hypothetical protein